MRLAGTHFSDFQKLSFYLLESIEKNQYSWVQFSVKIEQIANFTKFNTRKQKCRLRYASSTFHLSLAPAKSSCLLTTSLVMFTLLSKLAQDPLAPVVASLTGRYGAGCLYSSHLRDEPTVTSKTLRFGSLGAGSL